MKFLKGKKTYISFAFLAVLGALINLQSSCVGDVAELGEKVCSVVQNPWMGKAIIGLSAFGTWARNQANK